MREPYGDLTSVVRANGGSLAAIEALPFVRWIGHLPFEAHVARGLRSRRPLILPRTRLRTGVYTVQGISAWWVDPAVAVPVGAVIAGRHVTSVTTPGTAKNCITVGACESRRPEFDRET